MNTRQLLEQASKCVICESHLPLGARPVIQFNPNARILIAGQAPGIKVHETGLPFNDASGNRLREWLGLTNNEFYDENNIAILPIGFCYPGKGRSGDLPPRKECASAWRKKLLAQLPNIELTIILGRHAQAYHLPHTKKQPLTQLVKSWREYWPSYLVLPHPSPRNNIWLKKNPWFAQEVLPEISKRVISILTP
ncbi:uracil-DNA glycosylase family protein [Pseudoalteromonas sp. SG45-5]|uniref:uracil-DNA glycosylase family protein n=1 Tax=unclassified Pseudoalteromonas TaxID=194690 RepID=UPI0015FAB645|nr:MULTISPECIES: uracil-DNA glycosylase family protein [unclassified Pseudoalteromonas]MBB1387627.1 uracil-DNA glycosylase family protein [Pseudoalteromonas sp. SG45-5]MBB1395703.1 uracil-DNA glycosylase family protein [Pseudoalteromonas sp. SG44-4]MBB1448871.1 uracil-DNA glycosylase family protein [Pseudoalteromonas sp. SG41-6]